MFKSNTYQILSYLLILIICFPGTNVHAQTSNEKKIYLIPGQGADGRLFKDITIHQYDTIILNFITPYKNETMQSYARRMAERIDTTCKYSIVGVSLGGMLAVEMNKFLDPEETIIISSAKCKKELPVKYRMFNYFSLHKVLSGKFYIWGAKLGQPILEPAGKENRLFFREMLNAKDPMFMKRAVAMIVSWDNTEYADNIIHIQGKKDHTIPTRRTSPTIIVNDGNHVIAMKNSKLVSELLNQYLN